MTTDTLRCTEYTRIAGWMSALVTTATFSFLHDAYDRLPLLVPIRFEDGNPSQFAYKSPALVYLPFGMQLALALVFWYSLAKRFTYYTQAFLGLAMAVAPVGGWLAVIATAAVTTLWTEPWKGRRSSR